MGSLLKIFDVQSKVPTLARISSVLLSQANTKTQKIKKDERKRPASTFGLFFQEKQPLLKEENPHMKPKEIMKLASSMWKNEPSSIHQQYKNDYLKKMEDYKLSLKEVPKRPMPPYLQFYQDNDSDLQHNYPNVIDRAKKAGEMWKNLSDIEKKSYSLEYIKLLGEFNANLTEEERELLQEKRNSLYMRRQKRDIRRFGKEALKERPRSPFPNVFTLFVHDKASEVPQNENILKFLGQQWRNMSNDEKLEYKQKLDEVTEKFERDLAEWEEKYDRYSH